MNRGVIIHLDNEEEQLKDSARAFRRSGIDLDLVQCSTKEAFEAAVNEHSQNLRCLIFDLLSKSPDKSELEGDAEFLTLINEKFAKYNIPIFIYSGYLQSVEGKFESCGTVFKVDKGGRTGIQEIYEKIKLFHDSGFLKVFCPGGTLESQLHKDLHLAFVKQFRSNTQIEAIITQISKTAAKEPAPQRIEKVFKRIAVRSLLSSLLAPEIDANGKIIPESLNPVEHYLQRISPFPVWTGDIFKNLNNNHHLLILTPRCNVASKGCEDFLVCDIDSNAFPVVFANRDQKDRVNYYLTDKPEISGYDRYLPPSPLFSGGKVLLSKYSMINKAALLNDYVKIISLSDELTNEILGKFGSYFFRSGITPWNLKETLAHIEHINSKKEDN